MRERGQRWPTRPRSRSWNAPDAAIDGGLRPNIDRLLRVVTHAEHVDVDESTTREAIVLLTLELKTNTHISSRPQSRAGLRRARPVSRGSMRRDGPRGSACGSRHMGRERRRSQLTGPVMAKGAEDRAFYRYFPAPHRCARSAVRPACSSCRSTDSGIRPRWPSVPGRSWRPPPSTPDVARPIAGARRSRCDVGTVVPRRG